MDYINKSDINLNIFKN